MKTDIAILDGVIGLTLVWVSWFWVLRPSIVDWFRQQLFIIRDEMFVECAKGVFTNSVPYRRLRERMNGTIRSAGKLGVVQFFLSFFVVGRYYPTWRNHADIDMSSLGEEDRLQLEHFHKRFIKLLTVFLFARAPLFWVFAIPFGIGFKLLGLISLNATNRVRIFVYNVMIYGISAEISREKEAPPDSLPA